MITGCPCEKCDGTMRPGKALINTWWVHADFRGDYEGLLKDCPPEQRKQLTGQTMSRCGPPMLVDCYKCEKCGWSVISSIGAKT